MANAATIDIKGNNQPLKKDLNESESLVTSFGSKIVATFAAIGAAIAAKKTFDFAVGLGKSFLDAASEAEEAQAKLDAVLNATGHSAGFLTEQLVGLAGQLQATTKFSDEAVMSAQAILASFRNVRGDVFIEATKAIADMSTVMGTDLTGAALQVGKALNDPLQGMTALTRAGVTFTDTQKEMINTLIKSGDVMGAQRIILEELSHEFGGAAEAVGNTFGGQMERMKNRFGEIAEDLGRALMPAVEAFFPLVDAVATFTENSVPYFKAGIDLMIAGAQSLVQQLKPVYTFIVDASIASFTAVQVIIEDFSLISQRAMLGFQLGMLQAFEFVKHWLGTVIPELLTWFGDNWVSVFVNIQTFTATVFKNMFTNFSDFMKGIRALLSGEDGGELVFSALTKGFENTLKELPKITSRIISEDEKAALAAFNEIDAKIAGDFANKLVENRMGFDNFFKDMLTKKEEADIDLTNTADTKFNPDDFKHEDDKKDKVNKERAEKAKKEKEDKGAEFVALQDLNKRIQSAAMKSAEEMEKIAEKELEADNLNARERDNLFGGDGKGKKSPFKKSSEPDLILKGETQKALEALPQNDEEIVKALEKNQEKVVESKDILQTIADRMGTMNELLATQNENQGVQIEQGAELITEMPGIGGLY